MKPRTETTEDQWIATWLDAVQDGRSTMSQRARSAVDAHGGEDRVMQAARARGVHLMECTDDKGRKLIAASRHPFRTLC